MAGLVTGGRRNPITVTVAAAADDLNGAATEVDLTGSGGALIVVSNSGTAGTAGQDVVEFSRDGGSSFLPMTAANLNSRHFGLLDSAGAAVTDAKLNAVAGTEVDAIFQIPPVSGPFIIRVGRGGAGEAGIAWVTGAPLVTVVRLG